MKLSSFNEKMRQKPKRVRAQWAFWVAFLATGVLGLAWLAYIPGKLERIAEKANEDVEPRGNFGRVLENMKANVVSTVQNINKEFDAIKDGGTTTTPETVATSTNGTATTTDFDTIDFETFFENPEDSEEASREGSGADKAANGASSTESTSAPLPPQPRRVLIGTSSKATSTAGN